MATLDAQGKTNVQTPVPAATQAPAQDNPWEVASESPSKPAAATAPAATPTTPTETGSEWEVAKETPSAKPGILSKVGGAVSAYGDLENKFSKGLWEGAGQTVGTVSSLINKIPIVGETLAPKQGVTALKDMSTPESTPEKLGVGVESIAEFLAGDEAFAALGAAKKLGIATKLAEYAKTSPRLAAILNHGVQAVRQGTAAGVQSYAHGASPADALKTAGLATLLGTGTGAVVEGAGALKDVLKTQVVQKPLHEAIGSIVDEATEATRAARAAETAPKGPKYVYRSANVDEMTPQVGGTPTPHPESRGQSFEGEEGLAKAKQYAQPGQRGSSQGSPKPGVQPMGEDIPQKVYRTDLNKLPPSSYRLNTTQAATVPGATPYVSPPKYDFPKGLAPEHWEEVTPELEQKEAEEAEKAKASLLPTEPHPSITQKVERSANEIQNNASERYKLLDKATNGRVQRFMDKAKASNRQLAELGTSEDDYKKEASILKGLKENEDSMNEAFEDAKKQGVNPEIIDAANADWRKAQAAYEFDALIKRSHTTGGGGTLGVSTPEYMEHRPEKLDLPTLRTGVERMFKSGRLADYLGDDGARKMLNTVNDAHLKEAHILANQRIARYGALGAGSLALGAAGHYGVSAVTGH